MFWWGALVEGTECDWHAWSKIPFLPSNVQVWGGGGDAQVQCLPNHASWLHLPCDSVMTIVIAW